MLKRYQTQEMAIIFSEEYKLKKWLYVEQIVAEIQEELGIIPKGLKQKLSKISVTPERVHAIEKITNHDVIAFLTAAREKLGSQGKWLHFGLTSYDLVDTAFVLIILEAIEIILKEIKQLLKVLKSLSQKHRNTPQMGRTHGMYAQPITFGYKVSSWYEEILRAYTHLKGARQHIAYGKLSGAVGTYTMLSPTIEKKVMKKLSLKPEPVSTQVLPRDRFAFLISHVVLYVCALERIATEIRNLSRTEISEVSEPFTKGQKGSSAMPHKKNPITCERICGLARIARGFMLPVFENINLWHERDLTNSSAERIIFADCFHLTHYITMKMLWVVKHLNVYPEMMLKNIHASLGVYASQNLMDRLIERGMKRETAYTTVQKLSFKALSANTQLKDIVLDDKKIRRYLTNTEIEKIFDIRWYLRNIT